MSEKILVKKRIILFTLLAAAIAWIIFTMIPVTGSEYGSGISVIFLAAGMFAPAIASLLTRLITKEGFRNMYLRPHFKGHIRHYVLIWFAPAVLLLLSMAVYFLIFPGQFDPDLTILQQAAASGNAGGLTAGMLLLISALQIVVIGPIVNIIPTMGEELGWRGYLLPKLRTLMSDRKALVLTGVIWGLWHAPVIVMGHNYGTAYWGYPWLGILTMVFFCVVLGIVEGYATIKLDSAIPAAMIHSTVNAGAAFPIYMVNAGYNPILGPTIAGFLGGIPFVIVAVVLLVRIGKTRTLSAEFAEMV
ncbi:MAG: CPBP family intramembrane metalloprotease [Clostridiaceae bacterium]|jgi:membrane protease YdiL (CAAX protease family)|nr:CPBP family intramembrane metalloprotease [Clostridiaceae bacterium]